MRRSRWFGRPVNEIWASGSEPRGRHAQRRTYAESRELEPDDEGGLEGEVPGDIVEDQAQSKALEEVEEA